MIDGATTVGFSCSSKRTISAIGSALSLLE